jgi:hypothetical protein
VGGEARKGQAIVDKLSRRVTKAGVVVPEGLMMLGMSMFARTGSRDLSGRCNRFRFCLDSNEQGSVSLGDNK